MLLQSSAAEVSKEHGEGRGLMKLAAPASTVLFLVPDPLLPVHVPMSFPDFSRDRFAVPSAHLISVISLSFPGPSASLL